MEEGEVAAMQTLGVVSRSWRVLLLAGLFVNLLASGIRACDAAAQTWEAPAEIRAAVEKFVLAALPAGLEKAQVNVEGPAPNLHFPRCAQLQAQGFGSADPYGTQTVKVSCSAPARWSLYVTVAVGVPQGVVVTAHALGAGHVLKADDLLTLQRDVASLPQGAVSDPAQVLGQVLRYGVGAGQSLTQEMLIGPQLVHYGQSVSVVAQGLGVRMVALGTAMEDGRQGQSILVRNAQSGKLLSGVVDAAGEVVVALGM
jgi:flagella basal body P-ring formation protein FlgA